MNQKIKELYGAALDSAVPETWTNLGPEQLEKFSQLYAESIVSECIAICISNALDDLDTVGRTSSAKSAFDIKQHFGLPS